MVDATPNGARTTVHRGQTSKATVAAAATRKRKKAEQLALDLTVRLDALDGEWLSRLAFAVLAQCQLRGVEVWRDE